MMSGEQVVQLATILMPGVLALFAFLAALMAWLNSRQNKVVALETQVSMATLGKDVVATKEHINSRMTELLQVVTSEQRMKGVQEGIAQGRAAAEVEHTAQKLSREEGRAEGVKDTEEKKP